MVLSGHVTPSQGLVGCFTEQSSPLNPLLHEQTPFEQEPFEEQSLGQVFSQFGPAKPSLQMHLASLQTVLPEQTIVSQEGSFTEQSRPENPLLHEQTPFEQEPFEEQSLGQDFSVTEQSEPENPWLQRHDPFWQTPFLLQFFGQPFSQLAPMNPAIQTQLHDMDTLFAANFLLF